MKKIISSFVFTLVALLFISVAPASAQSGHNITLTWKPSPTGTTMVYNVWRGTASGAETVNVNTALISGLAFVDTTGVAGTTYFYIVRAVDPATGIASDNSNEVSATFLGGKPLPPQSVTATAN